MGLCLTRAGLVFLSLIVELVYLVYIVYRFSRLIAPGPGRRAPARCRTAWPPCADCPHSALIRIARSLYIPTQLAGILLVYIVKRYIV